MRATIPNASAAGSRLADAPAKLPADRFQQIGDLGAALAGGDRTSQIPDLVEFLHTKPNLLLMHAASGDSGDARAGNPDAQSWAP